MASNRELGIDPLVTTSIIILEIGQRDKDESRKFKTVEKCKHIKIYFDDEKRESISLILSARDSMTMSTKLSLPLMSEEFIIRKY